MLTRAVKFIDKILEKYGYTKLPNNIKTLDSDYSTFKTFIDEDEKTITVHDGEGSFINITFYQYECLSRRVNQVVYK